MRVCQFRHIRDCKSYNNVFDWKSQAFFQKFLKNIFCFSVDKGSRKNYTKFVNKRSDIIANHT